MKAKVEAARSRPLLIESTFNKKASNLD